MFCVKSGHNGNASKASLRLSPSKPRGKAMLLRVSGLEHISEVTSRWGSRHVVLEAVPGLPHITGIISTIFWTRHTIPWNRDREHVVENQELGSYTHACEHHQKLAALKPRRAHPHETSGVRQHTYARILQGYYPTTKHCVINKTTKTTKATKTSRPHRNAALILSTERCLSSWYR